jgi:hypothetical protein
VVVVGEEKTRHVLLRASRTQSQLLANPTSSLLEDKRELQYMAYVHKHAVRGLQYCRLEDSKTRGVLLKSWPVLLLVYSLLFLF